MTFLFVTRLKEEDGGRRRFSFRSLPRWHATDEEFETLS